MCFGNIGAWSTGGKPEKEISPHSISGGFPKVFCIESKKLAEQAQMIFGGLNHSLNNSTTCNENNIENEITDLTPDCHFQDKGQGDFPDNYDHNLAHQSFETWKQEILSGKRDKYEEEARIKIWSHLGIKEMPNQTEKPKELDVPKVSEVPKVEVSNEEKEKTVKQKIEEHAKSFYEHKKEGLKDAKKEGNGVGYLILFNGIEDILLDKSINHACLRFYLFLLKNMDHEKGYLYYSNKQFAKMFGVSEKQIKKYITELKEHDLIDRVMRYDNSPITLIKPINHKSSR